jgi:hypothetical protein
MTLAKFCMDGASSTEESGDEAAGLLGEGDIVGPSTASSPAVPARSSPPPVPVPAASVQAVGAKQALARIHKDVEVFALSSKVPGVPELRKNLQLYGGCGFLDPKFRHHPPNDSMLRTRPAPKKHELIDAWLKFLDAQDPKTKYDPSRFITDVPRQKKGRKGGHGRDAEGGSAGAENPADVLVKTHQDGLLVRVVDLKLERWCQHSAAGVLKIFRRVRAQQQHGTVDSVHEFRLELQHLLDDAVRSLYRKHLFNCNARQLLCHLPTTHSHFSVLARADRAHKCGEECEGGGDCAAADEALALAEASLCALQLDVLRGMYEAEGTFSWALRCKRKHATAHISRARPFLRVDGIIRSISPLAGPRDDSKIQHSLPHVNPHFLFVAVPPLLHEMHHQHLRTRGINIPFE